jgi:hypothetical protein
LKRAAMRQRQRVGSPDRATDARHSLALRLRGARAARELVSIRHDSAVSVRRSFDARSATDVGARWQRTSAVAIRDDCSRCGTLRGLA